MPTAELANLTFSRLENAK
jgi:uridine kinase